MIARAMLRCMVPLRQQGRTQGVPHATQAADAKDAACVAYATHPTHAAYATHIALENTLIQLINYDIRKKV